MSVRKERITTPKFKTEAAVEVMEQALKSGTARRKVPLKTVTMRLPVADLGDPKD